MFVVQPAEERVGGAAAMLEDGLYDRFGTPDYALAFHVASILPAGTAARGETLRSRYPFYPEPMVVGGRLGDDVEDVPPTLVGAAVAINNGAGLAVPLRLYNEVIYPRFLAFEYAFNLLLRSQQQKFSEEPHPRQLLNM